MSARQENARPRGPAPGAPSAASSNEPNACLRADRRHVLRSIGFWLGVAATGEFAALTLAFLRSRRPRPANATERIVVAGPVGRFAPGSVTAFRQGPFYLVRLEDGGFLALSSHCTHLGCSVPWLADQGRFVCPCHASAFDLRGRVLSPPAPRPLDVYPVVIENNVVRVDTAASIERKSFEASQVVHA